MLALVSQHCWSTAGRHLQGRLFDKGENKPQLDYAFINQTSCNLLLSTHGEEEYEIQCFVSPDLLGLSWQVLCL